MRSCRLRCLSYLTLFARSYGTASVGCVGSGPVLRDYQQECVSKCMEAISEGRMRIGVSLATGGGKTVIFSNLLARFLETSQKKSPTSLILVHRRELAIQAAATIHHFIPELDVQMEMGKMKANLEEADVVIGSVLSMVRRLEAYPPDSIDMIIIDEAHHSVADSYVRILEHFNASTPASAIPVIGFSATFERADKKSLSRVMDEIIYHKGILEMIDDKWLCEGKFTTVDVDVDLSKVKVSNSDFQVPALSKVINTKEINEVVVKTYLHMKQKHDLKSTLLFGVDVAHCKSLFELFQKNGLNAQYVTGRTRTTERDSIVKDFKDGKIQVLMNCGIFTEGTDIPNVDCILLCRPTKSRSLMVQMIGRGLRLHHSKSHCQIIDFVSSSKVGVVSIPTLNGIESYEGNLDEATLEEMNLIKKEIEQQEIERARRDYERTNDEKVLQKKYEDYLIESDSIELTLTNFEDFKAFSLGFSEDMSNMTPSMIESKLFPNSRFPWVKVAKSSWCFPLTTGRHIRIDKEKDSESNMIYVAKIYRKIPKYQSDLSYPLYSIKEMFDSKDLPEVLNTVEAFVSKLENDTTLNITKHAHWRRFIASPKQKAVVQKLFNSILKNDEKSMELEPLVSEFMNKLTKGQASSILFATSIAPKFPIKQILRLFSFRKAG